MGNFKIYVEAFLELLKLIKAGISEMRKAKDAKAKKKVAKAIKKLDLAALIRSHLDRD